MMVILHDGDTILHDGDKTGPQKPAVERKRGIAG